VKKTTTSSLDSTDNLPFKLFSGVVQGVNIELECVGGNYARRKDTRPAISARGVDGD
jgi:hypothetical protein